jgi:hypothetical protein
LITYFVVGFLIGANLMLWLPLVREAWHQHAANRIVGRPPKDWR